MKPNLDLLVVGIIMRLPSLKAIEYHGVPDGTTDFGVEINSSGYMEIVGFSPYNYTMYESIYKVEDDILYVGESPDYFVKYNLKSKEDLRNL